MTKWPVLQDASAHARRLRGAVKYMLQCGLRTKQLLELAQAVSLPEPRALGDRLGVCAAPLRASRAQIGQYFAMRANDDDERL